MNAPFECIYNNEIRSYNSTADILKTKNSLQSRKVKYSTKGRKIHTQISTYKQEKKVQKIKNRSSSTLIKEVKAHE